MRAAGRRKRLGPIEPGLKANGCCQWTAHRGQCLTGSRSGRTSRSDASPSRNAGSEDQRREQDLVGSRRSRPKTRKDSTLPVLAPNPERARACREGVCLVRMEEFYNGKKESSEEDSNDEGEEDEEEEEGEEVEENEEDADSADVEPEEAEEGEGEDEDEEDAEKEEEGNGQESGEEDEDFTIDAIIKDAAVVQKSFLERAVGWIGLGGDSLPEEHLKLIIENHSGKHLMLIVRHDPNQTKILELSVGLKVTSGLGGSRKAVLQKMPGDQRVPIRLGTVQKPSKKEINWSGDQVWVTICNGSGREVVGPQHLLIKRGQRLILSLE